MRSVLRVFFILIGLGYTASYAQQPLPDSVEERSLPVVTAPDRGQLIIPKEVRLPDPNKAAFYGAILPGAGQIYNGALWKVPLVYAGGAVAVYSVNFYNTRYSESLRSLRLIQYNANVTEVNNQGQSYYERATEFYRRQRDYSIILGGLYYGLTIVEAYVDAHLQSFRFSEEEFAMRIKPSVFTAGNQPAVGLSFTITLP